MELRINTESPAAHAIIAMSHAAGTAEIYIKTLSRLSNAVLFNQDDMGMGDTETLDTIRVLSLLRSDIQDIAADKTIARLIERADDDPDEIKNVLIVPYDTETAIHTERPCSPWDSIMVELKRAAEILSLDETADTADIICDVNALIDRVSSAREWSEACAENQKYTDDEHGAPLTRTLTYLAHSKTVHSFECLEDVQDGMVRAGYSAAKIADIAEVIKLQKKAAEILRRVLDELTESEAENKEGGNNDK